MTQEIVATAFGGPDVLAVREHPLADPGPGQVLVDVRAIGVNPIDFKLYSGAFGTDASKLPLSLGSEASGMVVAVGEGAAGPAGPISVGDEVIVNASGVYAERVLVDGDDIVPKPESLPWDQAAGLLAVAGTAFDTVEVVGITSGDTVLVHGASGAVGELVVQLARSLGATVIGTAGETNLEFVRSLGATAVRYGDGLTERVREAAPNGVDAVIDTAGADGGVDTSLELVADRDRIVTIAAFGRAAADSFKFVGGPNPESGPRRRAARLDLVAAAGRGDLTITVAKTFRLVDAAIAHRELSVSHPHGKFVLLP